jgi:homoserine O-succinyltransferase
MDDIFPCPVCKNSGITAASLEENRQKGDISLLAFSEEAGYIMAETTDRRFLMHFGHPELEPEMMLSMCNSCGTTQTGFVEKTAGDELLNTWRGHRSVLFSQWIKYIHETGTY